MAFIIGHDVWVAKEVVKVKGILSQQMVDGQQYTTDEILTLLEKYGLDYSNPHYVEIGAVLLADGFIEST